MICRLISVEARWSNGKLNEAAGKKKKIMVNPRREEVEQLMGSFGGPEAVRLRWRGGNAPFFALAPERSSGLLLPFLRLNILVNAKAGKPADTRQSRVAGMFCLAECYPRPAVFAGWKAPQIGRPGGGNFGKCWMELKNASRMSFYTELSVGQKGRRNFHAPGRTRTERS